MNQANTSVRIGVVGAGSMGRNHVRVATGLKQMHCVGIYDPNPVTGNNVAASFGTRYYDNFDALLGDIDALIIAAPTTVHFELAKTAISRGIHCLIEKPITVTVAEAEELLALATENGVVLQVGHVERYNPVYAELKKILEGEEVLAIKASRLSYNVSRANDVDVVLDLMIHDIDTINQLLGRDVEVVSAVGGRYLSPSMDYASALMRSSNGAVAELTASKVSQTKNRELVISCKDCFIRVDYLRKEIEIFRHASGKYIVERDGVHYKHEALIERVLVPNIESLVAEHVNFAESVIGKETPVVSGHDGLAALKLAIEVQNTCKIA